MKMDEKKPKPIIFAEALDEGVNSAFADLRNEIMKSGALSPKEKAIVGLACAVAIRCDTCVESHKKMAKMAGVTKEEMLEAAAIGGLVRLGSGFATASLLLDD